MSSWTANTQTPIAVDGQFGPATVKALQFGLLVKVDGVFGAVTAKAFQSLLGVTADGQFGPVSVKALQTKLGITPDTVWGPQTTIALQLALNAGTLGNSGAAVAPNPAGLVVPIDISAVTYGRYSGGGSVASWMSSAASAAGVNLDSDRSGGLGIIWSDESANDPNAVNNYDLNAWGPVQSDGYPLHCSRGIAQCIPDTFAKFHVAGTSNSIYDPVANGAASIRYILATYGGIDNVPGVKSVRAGGSYQGY